MPFGDDIVLWALLSAAVITDLKTGKIYNLLTLPFLLAGLIYRFSTGGTSALLISLYAVALAFILFFPLYALKIFGAGDVKLLMAVGAWTNMVFVMQLGAVAIVIGAVVGGFILFRRKGASQFFSSLGEQLKPNSKSKALRIPFGPAFLCAFFWMKIAEEYQWSVF